MTPARVLLVDDDDNLRWVLETQLRDAGYGVVAASSAEAALEIVDRSPPAVVLSDLKMPRMSGLDLLNELRRSHPGIPVIIFTAFGSIQSAVQAMRAGAWDYLTKPIDADEMLIVLQRALEHSRLVEEVQTLRLNLDRKFGFENILGRSSVLLSVLDMAARAAKSESTILIRAETGTGKDLLARAIHFNSPRRDRPFVTINCGAIPRDLLESELFGHMKGAFTGALTHKKGKVEMANRGTIFLDEIGEMPSELQVKVLRLIQHGEIEKLGAASSEHIDVRIIAATHRDLRAMIEDGTFREDLFYRLAVIPIEIPPLRDRRDDIPELLQHFFHRACAKMDRPDLRLPESLIPYFQNYRWPGNVRELENVVERIVVLTRGDEVTFQDLPEPLRKSEPGARSIQLEMPDSGISLDSVEKDLIVKALERFNGNQTHAAKYLDISRKTLIYRMEKYGLK